MDVKIILSLNEVVDQPALTKVKRWRRISLKRIGKLGDVYLWLGEEIQLLGLLTCMGTIGMTTAKDFSPKS
jgi:hypothetical protein